MSRLSWIVLFSLVLASAAGPARNAAQLSAAEPKKDDAPAVDAETAAKLASPRAAVKALLEAINANNKPAAAKCLDLSQLDAFTAKNKGGDYAYQLKEILDRMERIDLDELPDEPDAASPVVLGDYMSTLTGQDLADARRIKLTRGNDDLWRFDAETVTAAKELWPDWQDREEVQGLVASKAREPFALWLPRQFPPSLRETRFLLPSYQWICLAALVFLGFVVDLIVRSLLHYVTRAWFKFVKTDAETETERKVWRPVGLLAQALVWYSGATLIGLEGFALWILLPGLKFFAVVASVWTAFLVINLVANYFARKATTTESKLDDLLVPLISKSMKVLAVLVGILMCAEAFDLPIMGLLGSLGIGGIALALASKDAVSNFFGSITVLVDRPFEIGDWVVTNDVEGTVETVGFRSTRIRTFYNSLISVPNCLLTTAVVDNMGRRRYRRIKSMLGLQYDTTPQQMQAFCEGVRELIRRHPYTRKDYYHVYVNQFKENSVDVLLYCFVEVPDWSVELRERHRLFIDIMKLAESLGVSFAFPTRSLQILEKPTTEEFPEPLVAGRHAAADIAGELLPPHQRPGRVELPGPAPVESDEPDDADDGNGGE